MALSTTIPEMVRARWKFRSVRFSLGVLSFVYLYFENHLHVGSIHRVFGLVAWVVAVSVAPTGSLKRWKGFYFAVFSVVAIIMVVNVAIQLVGAAMGSLYCSLLNESNPAQNACNGINSFFSYGGGAWWSRPVHIMLTIVFLWMVRTLIGSRTQPASRPTPIPQVTKIDLGAGYCGECGSPLVPSSNFCQECGSKIQI